MFTILSIIVIQTKWPVIENSSPGPSTVELTGKLILEKYLLPFELVSILLLAALVGAELLARKKSIIDNSWDIDKVVQIVNYDYDVVKVDINDKNKI